MTVMTQDPKANEQTSAHCQACFVVKPKGDAVFPDYFRGISTTCLVDSPSQHALHAATMQLMQHSPPCSFSRVAGM